MSVTLTIAQQGYIPNILEMIAEFYAIDDYPFDLSLNRKRSKAPPNPVVGRLPSNDHE